MLADDKQVQEELALGFVMLEQARQQTVHLAECKKQGLLDAELLASER